MKGPHSSTLYDSLFKVSKNIAFRSPRKDQGLIQLRWAQLNQPVVPPDFAHSESPRYVSRAIVSLALDPDRKRWNQQSLSSGELARVYGFTDLDGTIARD
jgi:hypothetical protein